MTLSLVIGLIALAIWIYLILFRGFFWLLGENEDRGEPVLPPLATWPSVVAIIPARNEASMLPLSLPSLLAQNYPGAFSVVLVDDDSSDGTSSVARSLAAGASRGLSVLEGEPLSKGWTGKLWAMQQGLAEASAAQPKPDYLLLTDADIAYAQDTLVRLVARARAGKLVLVSLMAKLNCVSLAEHALVPAFVFFFQMLYPFAAVNRRAKATAAAAGGCMLVEREALERAGGIGRIRGALIDDCALGALLKQQGPIWLGLTDRVRSLRPYPDFGDIRVMVARSAYAQLRYSPLLLAGTIIGMILTYLAAPIVALFSSYPASIVALLAWMLMTLSFLPILRFYKLNLAWALVLLLIALAYSAFTLDSAYQHWRGRGGAWKGRKQALTASQ